MKTLVLVLGLALGSCGACDMANNCKPGVSKPCGKSCIALNETCHKDTTCQEIDSEQE